MAEEKKKSWFGRHKILTGVLVVVALFIIGVASSSETATNNSSENSTNSSTSAGAKEYRFNDRADKQEKDVELAVGESGTVNGVKMTLTNVEYKTRMSEYEQASDGKTYVIANVQLENTSNETKPYNVFDFRIQTAGGQVLDGAFASVPTPLSSGDMVTGGKAQGQIVFEVPLEEGSQYVIWKPNAFKSDRAIVQVR
jgi:hypothetical protein